MSRQDEKEKSKEKKKNLLLSHPFLNSFPSPLFPPPLLCVSGFIAATGKARRVQPPKERRNPITPPPPSFSSSSSFPLFLLPAAKWSLLPSLQNSSRVGQCHLLSLSLSPLSLSPLSLSPLFTLLHPREGVETAAVPSPLSLSPPNPKDKKTQEGAPPPPPPLKTWPWGFGRKREDLFFSRLSRI